MAAKNQYYPKLQDNLLNEFRILVRKAMFLKKDEESLFYAIPEHVWKNIFETNFNSEYTYARNVILGHTDTIVHSETKYLERVKRNIDNYQLSVNLIQEYLKSNKKIIFITDFDNDGSISQAIINQIFTVLKPEEAKNVLVEYARSVDENKNRGFTGELVHHIAKANNLDKDSDFLIITADNGINSRTEQEKIHKQYPNAKLLITDHHNPEPDMMVIENKNTVIFNPHYFALELTDQEILKERGILDEMKKSEPYAEKMEAYEFFRTYGYNISGATTVGLLISEIIKQRTNQKKLTLDEQLDMLESGKVNNALKMIAELSRISNMVDYVRTAPADKPYNYKEINNASLLQSLLNTNNSSSNLILNLINQETLDYLSDIASHGSEFDVNVLLEENKKIMSLNIFAQGILSHYQNYNKLAKTAKEELLLSSFKNDVVNDYLVKMISDPDSFKPTYVSDNKNYIEQLRPLIFELTVDDTKNNYHEQLLQAMLDVYQKLSISEKMILKELRKTNIMRQSVLEHSTISILDAKLQHVFNRKLLNKAYNGVNNGFNLTIDNIQDNIISGSFRSTYNISDILPSTEKDKLGKRLGVHIETPGHEQAAGFIITKRKGSKKNFDIDILDEINQFINQQLVKLKSDVKYRQSNDIELVTDLDSLDVLSRLNEVIRGQVSYFAKITPIIKLSDENMVFTDGKTGAQTLLSEQVKNQEYGWTHIQTKLSTNHDTGHTVLIPIGVLKSVVDSGFEKYLRLNFLNTGVFIGEKPVQLSGQEEIVLLEKDHSPQRALIDAMKDGKLNSPVLVTREELQDNPFFKFNPYGVSDFEKFEQVIIKIIEENGLDSYSVFDVEADGFSLARLLNIGFLNYQINEAIPENNDGITKLFDKSTFNANVYTTLTGKKYFIDQQTMDDLNIVQINKDEFEKLRTNHALRLINRGNKYYKLPFDVELIDKQEDNHIFEVKNYRLVDGNKYLVNRTLQAETMAFLVKPEDFVIPPTISKLTGITNEISQQYGLPITHIDKIVSDYFADKTTMFIAHNTEYDGRIVQANLPHFSQVLNSYRNMIADSAHFSQQYRLMYDNIDIVTFHNIPGLKDFYFYNNEHSKFNLGDFIQSDEDGEFPDIKNNIHLVKKFNPVTETHDFYIRNMDDNTFIKLDLKIKELDKNGDLVMERPVSLRELFFEKNNNRLIESKSPVMIDRELPLNLVGYKAQGLGEMKFIRQLLLLGEEFNIKLIDDFSKYPSLVEHKDKLIEFQKYYRFNKGIFSNLSDFQAIYPELSEWDMGDDKFIREMNKFVVEFISNNKNIENRYNDTWYYQAVLKVFEPNMYTDLNMTNYDLVSSQTGVPVKLVEEVAEAAYKFKRHYKNEGCTQVIANEVHVNGPYKGNIVGDVAYEDKATMMLLIDKFTNKFSNDIQDVTDVFNRSQREYSLNFIKQQAFAFDKPIDSMGFQQHKNFLRRDEKSKVIEVLEKQNFNILENTNSNIVKFKLSTNELQDNKHVYAITRPNIVLDDEQVKSDADKIKFIVACLQIGSEHIKSPILSVYNDNIETMKRYKKELLEHYAYLEINNSTEQVSDYVKDLSNFILTPIDKAEAAFKKVIEHKAITPAKRSNAVDGLESISYAQLQSVQDVLLHTLFNRLSQIGCPKHEIAKLGNMITTDSHEIDSEQFSDTDVRMAADLIKLGRSWQEDCPQEIRFDNSSRADAIERIQSEVSQHYDFINDDLINLSKVFLVNSLAIHHKVNYPNRLTREMENLSNSPEEYDYKEDNKPSIEEDHFLSEKHSIIKRNSPAKHLMGKFNYLDLTYQTIFKHYIEPELELRLKKAKKVTNSSRSLSPSR